ncbi:zinc ribbon domain-containing protein [Natrialba sp. SSL1]|uniref:zinc ribbon domain-containing protein n=1 Tax=Natrialba sp. SSL1 TaxID=1869245 RepID=UPI00209B81AE|nr:zinc ribbon domain-containing protein [Natrialba sp. SSL1]
MVDPVEPSYTSQQCSKCGCTLDENREVQHFACLDCAGGYYDWPREKTGEELTQSWTWRSRRSPNICGGPKDGSATCCSSGVFNRPAQGSSVSSSPRAKLA